MATEKKGMKYEYLNILQIMYLKWLATFFPKLSEYDLIKLAGKRNWGGWVQEKEMRDELS